LLVDELLERGLLFGAAFQNKNHAVKRYGIAERAAVELGSSQRVRIARESGEVRVVHSLNNA
jgi:hypothetical protein